MHYNYSSGLVFYQTREINEHSTAMSLGPSACKEDTIIAPVTKDHPNINRA